MGRCAGIKRDGDRCTLPATTANRLCWLHDPSRADQRTRNATRAGRARGTGEITSLKNEVKDLISNVESGDLDRNDAAVMVQAYRVLKDYIELERRVRETDDLAAEIEELKREYGLAH
jgi:hypothetical protein